MSGQCIRKGFAGGFTLIEIITTLTVASILGAMLVQIMGANLMRSVDPVNMVRAKFEVNQVIERITADYKTAIRSNSLDLGSFNLTGYEQNGITITKSLIGFNSSTGEEVACSSNCLILKVAVAKSGQSVVVLFTQ